MVFLHALIKLHPGKLQAFKNRLAVMAPLQARHGWKLIGCFSSISGDLNTVIDLWELPNPNALQAALADPAFAEHSTDKWEIVAHETLTLFEQVPVVTA
ncbi:NIPSNAP family protein [Paraburkholderia sp. SG-MS1]|uniref:NIPSNAP family protein n=1 Tax=Paraburkholderia sp. SG-MS1 TaxID=2023741 RepID=UPI001447EF67|nr:NIPSNAP family protein [Paraburkholderia sp. SG-MS1]